jgi:hypothetical protein
MTPAPFAAGMLAFTALAGNASAQEFCVECLEVRVGPAEVVRGPFPDELDAPFAAIRLADGSFRGFSANGATYAVDGDTLWDMEGERRAVLDPGPAGEANECGRWLTSTVRAGETLIGMVHQESICNYGPGGQTDKTMAIATSLDDGLTWTDLGTVLSGADVPAPGTTSGEGDCTMIDGQDGYLYAYCLRNTDYQTIVARAPMDDPTGWRKYFEGGWDEPGLDGQASAIGFVGIGTGYMRELGMVAAIATDPWFGGLRLSFSADKVSFVDLSEPLVTIDGSDWERPAPTDLIAYSSLIDPETGTSAIGQDFILSSIYIPPGEGFESRYLVHREVSMVMRDAPLPDQVGIALTRWVNAAGTEFVSSTGPLTGDRRDFQQDRIVAYMLTAEPEDAGGIRFEECSRDGRQALADAGSCEPAGLLRERTAGWLYASEQPGTLPVYQCLAASGARFVSAEDDCEGLGNREFRLGYGLAP